MEGSKLKEKAESNCNSMIKVKAQGSCHGILFDECGQNQIYGIYISRDTTGITSIQFGYMDNDPNGSDKNVILSPKYCSEDCKHFHVVKLKYPSEYLTSMRGSLYKDPYGKFLISSLSFETNQRINIGPFGSDGGTKFSFNMEDDFYGFYGFADECYLRAIGVYVKPMVSLANLTAKTTSHLDQFKRKRTAASTSHHDQPDHKRRVVHID